MRLRTIIFVMVSVSSIIFISQVEAQLFGDRTLGQPLTKQPEPGAASSSASGGSAISGGARFLRENRDERSFVGADSEEGSGFVGLEQGSTDGNVRTAVQDFQVERSQAGRINRPLRRPQANQMYLPRLSLGFSVPKADPILKAGNLKQTLASASPIQSVAPGIEVSFADGQVTLRGQVQDDRQRQLCSRLLMFEPGVNTVHNELEVSLAPQPIVPIPN
ncbi:BON domain-containing protein [Polystyrenella longa]|uniref:BON domain-containing protein n=1 Tax=Polystyrenella longa TaxID=2528007 RepID=UPI0011A8432B